jgi:excinuclease ABC subunit A
LKYEQARNPQGTGHNLKNIDLDLLRDRLIVVSGSGKSSMAFDTVFAEGQRHYVESLSAAGD